MHPLRMGSETSAICVAYTHSMKNPMRLETESSVIAHVLVVALPKYLRFNVATLYQRQLKQRMCDNSANDKINDDVCLSNGRS